MTLLRCMTPEVALSGSWTVQPGRPLLEAERTWAGKGGIRFGPMADIPVSLYGVLRWRQSRKGEIPR